MHGGGGGGGGLRMLKHPPKFVTHPVCMQILYAIIQHPASKIPATPLRLVKGKHRFLVKESTPLLIKGFQFFPFTSMSVLFLLAGIPSHKINLRTYVGAHDDVMRGCFLRTAKPSISGIVEPESEG